MGKIPVIILNLDEMLFQRKVKYADGQQTTHKDKD